jgi:putative Ca2+/H+ antiporter (TMEM165/GDT1 family)
MRALGICVALLCVTTLYLVQDRIETSKAHALGGGALYTILCLVLWGGARALVDYAMIDPLVNPRGVAVGILFIAPPLLLQGAVPVYLYARYRWWSVLVGLFCATWLTMELVLFVGGETPTSVLYPFVFLPMALGLVLGPVVIEAGLREAHRRARQLV